MTSLLHFIVCLPLKADGEASTGGGVRFPGRPTPPLSTSKPFTFTRFAASFEDEIETMAAHAKYGRFLTHRQIDGVVEPERRLSPRHANLRDYSPKKAAPLVIAFCLSTPFLTLCPSIH